VHDVNQEVMMSEPHAMIYLSSQRGCTQSDWFRTYHSLNFGSYYNKSRTPFHRLTALNDETLKASHTIAHPAVEDCAVLLLPLVGRVEYATDGNERLIVEAGESVLINIPAGAILHVRNPYENELVNYLHVWFSVGITNGVSKVSIDLPGHQNNFITLYSEKQLHAHVGRFSGRADSVFNSTNDSRHVFAYVIEGAFEFQNRLLESRDGLALSNITTSEFEALSNDAILLILEV
jgi:redox-sensitive bicupin YhaK (pirin superfamily)